MRTLEALVLSSNYKFKHVNFIGVFHYIFEKKMQLAAKYFIFYQLRTIMESNQIIHGASGDK